MHDRAFTLQHLISCRRPDNLPTKRTREGLGSDDDSEDDGDDDEGGDAAAPSRPAGAALLLRHPCLVTGLRHQSSAAQLLLEGTIGLGDIIYHARRNLLVCCHPMMGSLLGWQGTGLPCLMVRVA